MLEAERTSSREGSGLAGSTQRRAELQDFFNRALYHPLARRLAALLARTPITPNQVSIGGGLCVVAAAIAYAWLPWPQSVWGGLVLHMTWHVVDGADGDLARMTSRSSALGETIDGVSDYGSHAVLYVLLAHLLAQSIGGIAWLVMAAAGLSRVAQTNHFEVQRRLYQWRVYGTDWVGSVGIAGSGALQGLLKVYLRLGTLLAPPAPRVEAALQAAREDVVRLNAMRLIVRRELIAPLGRLAPLGSNQRTLALGLSMLAGSPLWYFIYEATLLNLLLLLSIRRHRLAMRSLVWQLDQAEASNRR